MDLPKLLDIVLRRQLHLTRLDKLEDRFEGTLPLRTRGATTAEIRKYMESPTGGQLMAEFFEYALGLKDKYGTTAATTQGEQSSPDVAEGFLYLMKMARGLAVGIYESHYGRPIDGPRYPNESDQEFAARMTMTAEAPAELMFKAILYARVHGAAPKDLDQLRDWPPKKGAAGFDLATRDRLLEEIVDRVLAEIQRCRRRLYVNSWHLGEIESEAMWRIYCRNGDGLAVVLPYSQLRDSLYEPDTYIGKVNYLRFNLDLMENLDPPHNFALAMQKRKEFEHESEARIVAARSTPGRDPFQDAGPESVELPWAPEDLIERIVISPYVKPWYADTVREIIGRIAPRLHGRVEVSSMAGDPSV
jgi:hypothetical protein